MVFDSNYFAAFAPSRVVPAAVANFYLWLLLDSAGKTVLDVGAGTGQFASLAVSEWGSDVTLLEPAPAAAAFLRQHFGNSVIEARFDDFAESASSSFDAILLSECVHLLEGDDGQIVEQLGRLTKHGTRAVLRTSSLAQLRARSWYGYFPGALDVDTSRHRDIEAIQSVALSSGLRSRIVTVDESRWVPAQDYISWFSLKAFSTLRLIDELDFESGLVDLVRFTDGKSHVWHDYKMSALVLEW